MYALLSLTMYVVPVTLSLHDEWKNHLAACLIDYNILIIEEEIAKGLYINIIVIKCLYHIYSCNSRSIIICVHLHIITMTQYITTYIEYNLLLIIILLSLKFYCHMYCGCIMYFKHIYRKLWSSIQRLLYKRKGKSRSSYKNHER